MLIEKEMEIILKNEAYARCRYEIYAEKAREEGLHYIAKVLEETARNELSHVRELMMMLNHVGTTKDNINTAILGEVMEAEEIYPKLRELSITDNQMDYARFFQQLAKIEKRHEERLRKIKELLEADQVYERAEAIIWKCRNCGYIHEGTKPPKKCPGCQNTMEYFEPEDFAV